MTTHSPGKPSRAGRKWRVIPPLFLLAEIVVVIGLFQLIGWWTVVLLLGLSALGVLVIGTATRRSWSDIQDMRRTGVAPERTAGDAAFTLVAGLLLIFPGILSSVIGLLLLVPFTRTWVRRLAGAATSRALLRTMGVRVHHGAGGSVFGDVVPGQTTPAGGTRRNHHQDAASPPLLEGRVVDRSDGDAPGSSARRPGPGS